MLPLGKRTDTQTDGQKSDRCIMLRPTARRNDRSTNTGWRISALCVVISNYSYRYTAQSNDVYGGASKSTENR